MTDNEIYYMVIHVRGGLSYAEMQWFDEGDYNLASKRKTTSEKYAIQYGKQLAQENGLKWLGGEYKGILD